jgi:N-acetylglucosamine repressor
MSLRSGRPRLIRQLNDRSVFEAIEEMGLSSRAQLSRVTGGSAPTMAKAVRRLRQLGLLDEVGLSSPDGAGRPGRMFRVAKASSQVIGIVIDYRFCQVTPAALDGSYHRENIITIKTPPDYRSLLRDIVKAVRKLAAAGPKTLALGISVPGMIDRSDGKVLLSPNMHSLDGQRVGADIESETGINAYVLHETLASCLAEQSYGVAKKLQHLILISVLEGYACSAVVGGQLLEGHDGMAGEMGHIPVDLNGEVCGCGNRGCIETLATDQSLARRVSRRLGRKIEIEEMVEVASRGEMDIADELNETLNYLAIGVAGAVNTFNPELVLVASRMFDLSPNAFDDLINLVRQRSVRPLVNRCRIVRSAGDKLQGGVAAALRGLKNSLGPTMNWK